MPYSEFIADTACIYGNTNLEIKRTPTLLITLNVIPLEYITQKYE
jgi:hypothetical protein